jgi:hypothetical protein
MRLIIDKRFAASIAIEKCLINLSIHKKALKMSSYKSHYLIKPKQLK